jgi:hypothetical protein
MGSKSSFTEEIWNGWLEPFHAVRLLIEAGLDDREHAVNWLKGRLREGELWAGGWHIEFLSDDPIKTATSTGLYKVSTWSQVAVIPWKDDFWISGNYAPDDPLDAMFRRSGSDEFKHYLTGVRFDPSPIIDFCRRARERLSAEIGLAPTKGAGGRPPKPFWDHLWPSIAADLYSGDLKPQRQSDIEKAMLNWLAAHGHEAGESTIRRAARQLWHAIIQEDQN